MTRVGKMLLVLVTVVGCFWVAFAVKVALDAEHRYDVWAPLLFGSFLVVALFVVWLVDITVRAVFGVFRSQRPNKPR